MDFRLFLFIALAVVSATTAPASARDSPQIWFTPLQGTVNESGGGVSLSGHDFPAMMRSPALWSHAASYLSEMSLDIVHFAEGEIDLHKIIPWQRTLPFAIGGSGSVVFTAPRCSPASEGLTGDRDYAREAVLTLHTWKQAGGRLDYFVLDSPFYFGYYAAQQACHFTVDDVAQRAAATVNLILRDFPNVQIVDAEGPGPVTILQWEADYSRFLSAFAHSSGRPIAWLAMDMHWSDSWHTGYEWVRATRELTRFAHARGLRAGLIINADDPEFGRSGRRLTESDWMRANRDHMQMARDARLPLDAIIINSWMRFPQHNLPEVDPLAYTSLVTDAARIWHVLPLR
jgi:hypothetical protein